VASLRKSITVSILFTLFGGPGLLLVVVPWLVTRFRLPAEVPGWQVVLCALLIAGGLVPLFESILRFIVVGRGTLVPTVPTEHLVASGLYAYVRNPMYLGVLTVLAAQTVLFRSRGLLIELAAAWFAIELFVRFYEERRLARAFPEDYALYSRNVRRWLPRLSPWRRRSSA
jgi:protein-S-isoprenylcysteine O-methyltransferase Ste14